MSNNGKGNGAEPKAAGNRPNGMRGEPLAALGAQYFGLQNLENQDLKLEICEIQKQVEAAECQLKKKHDDMAKRREQDAKRAKQLQAQLHDLMGMVRGVSANLAEIHSQNQQLRQLRRAKQQECRRLKKEESVVEAESLKHAKEIESVNSGLAGFREQLDKLLEAEDQSRKRYETTLQQAKAAEKLQRDRQLTIARLKKSIYLAQLQKEQLQAGLQRRQDLIRENAQIHRENQTKLRELEKSKADLEARIESMRSSVLERGQACNKLAEEGATVAKELGEAEAALATLQTQHRNLRDSLRMQEERNALLTQELNATNAEIARLEEQDERERDLNLSLREKCRLFLDQDERVRSLLSSREQLGGLLTDFRQEAAKTK